MNDNELHSRFLKAVQIVRNYHKPLPADLLLQLYACYKVASKNNNSPGSRKPLINAFKANALFQARNLSKSDAKKRYIELVDKHLR